MPEKFTSNGKSYDITIYPPRPEGGRNNPVLLLLHGNLGLQAPFGDEINAFAASMAGRPATFEVQGMTMQTSVGLGYVTAVPDYFGGGDHRMEENPAPYVDVLADAIQYATRSPGADPARVGLVGYSLGAAIAMTYIAERPATEVKVLVDYFGLDQSCVAEPGILPTFAGKLSKFPPTLTLHDAKDVVVPVDRSVELHALFPSGVEHELNVYVTEPVQMPESETSPVRGNHAFTGGGYADVASRNAAANWIFRHMPPIGA